MKRLSYIEDAWCQKLIFSLPASLEAVFRFDPSDNRKEADSKHVKKTKSRMMNNRVVVGESVNL